ncbi:caveolin-1-like [Mizuhopecten yessoensis]|uniref:Caveolin-1 n=1 Tax=Mizuhopecten yessoensis TaxID=6573 RepID=A0A210QWX6_MIZYE|nr:caveolin-1-like [Mizuhopecten yessoensis]OWF53213.1 Caveolin-1 [Mizuhopecten yessoensis]
MADNSPQQSDDERNAPSEDGDAGQGQTQKFPSNPPSRSPSTTSADSHAAKSSLQKESKHPEIHRPAPPVPVSVRTSKYENTYDVTYDDIPLSQGNPPQVQQQPTPPGHASPYTGTPTQAHTLRGSASQYNNEPSVPHIDLIDRDPTHINDDVKVEFDDLFAEPDGSHSIDCVWVNSAIVFTKTKFWCYRILTAIFAIPCAFCWGISFACLTCGTVWNVRPLIRRYAIEIIPYAKIWRIFLEAIVSPVFEACGRIFSGITITMKKE